MNVANFNNAPLLSVGSLNGVVVNASSSTSNNIAIGSPASVSANSAVAIGNNSTANGLASVVIGQGANAAAHASCVAIGPAASVSGANGVAIGRFTSAANLGVAIGLNANAGLQGVAIGSGATAPSQGIAIGIEAVALANEVRVGGGNDYWVSSIGGPWPWTNTSDIRFKKNVIALGHGLDVVKELTPICFKFDALVMAEFVGRRDEKEAEIANRFAGERAVFGESADIDARESAELALLAEKYNPEKFVAAESQCHVGFGAQDVLAALALFGISCDVVIPPTDPATELYTMGTASLVPFLVKAVQELSATHDALAAQIAALEI